MGPKSAQLDGQQQQEAYIAALQTSASYFRALLSSSSSKAWKPIAIPSSSTSGPAPASLGPSAQATAAAAASRKGKEPASSSGLDPANVVVHRRSGKTGEVYRATLELPIRSSEAGVDGKKPKGESEYTTEGFRAVLATAEIRALWDRMVDSAQTVEQLDADSRIVRTAYRLGWPSSPRDTITISKTFSDADAVIHVSTSLPRSPDEPAYLRPAPPYVRADVSLLAFCVQMPKAQAPAAADRASSSGHAAPVPTIRVSVFWQWNPKGTWAVGSSLGYHLPTLLVNLVETARDYRARVPLLTGYGRGIALGSTSFDVRHEVLALDWRVVSDGDDVRSEPSPPPPPSDFAGARRPSDEVVDRTLDFALPEGEGWRVQVTLRGADGEDDGKPPTWSAFIGRFVSHPSSPSSSDESKPASTSTLVPPPSPSPSLLLRVSHPPLADPTQSLRFKITITRDTASKAIRLNGVSQPVATIPLDSAHGAPFASADNKRLSRQLAGAKDGEETASLSGVSLNTIDTVSSVASSVGSDAAQRDGGLSDDLDGQRFGERSEKAEKSVLSLIRRNYIYFTSLLQEPEAKWRPVLEAAKGVSVHQLDSIDRTLVVYRAEAVFVGVGIWDLLAAISTTGARSAWDKTHEDAMLLEDVNELSELWWWKTKAAWPVAPRDSVHLRTTYKSPTSIHIFAFSTDDTSLFPAIPPTNPSIIRTQVDLLGWSIEALSPNTTQVTMLEQSDPKGWTNKSSIPQTMATALAGIGDFAIRAGGPPMITRLGYAKVLSSKFDLDKNMLRVEYQSAEWRRSKIVSGTLAAGASAPLTSLEEASLPAAKPRSADPDHGPIPNVECELRCDTDTWASTLDIVIDPPPQSVTCLRRHRLSAGGGGCWITIEHDAVLLDKEPVLLIVRKSPRAEGAKDKHVVVVNGAKIKVDVEALPEVEAKSLAKQKRTKPARIPLDQPPAVGGTRKVSNPPPSSSAAFTASAGDVPDPVRRALTATFGGMASPLFRAWLPAGPSVSQIVPPPAINAPALPPLLPAQVALNALDSIRLLHTQWCDKEFWALVSNKDGLLVEKRVAPFVSTAHPVHRSSKVLEGFSAEDVASVVSTPGTRRYWDDKASSVTPLQSFGNGCSADFVTARCAFPFRERGFYVASTSASITDASPSTPTAGPSAPAGALYFVQSSFNPAVLSAFDRAKVNPQELPIGEMLVEGWVLENVDPYGDESLVIPSTRCTYFSAIDYAGSIPSAMNSSINSTLPTVILGVEAFLQKRSAAPQIRFPAAGVNFEVGREDFASASNGAVQMKAWGLEDVDEERVFIGDSFDPAEAEYRSAYLVRLATTDPQATPVAPPSKRLPLPEGWTAAEGGSQPSSQTLLTRMRSSGSLRSGAEGLARQEPTAGNVFGGSRIPHSASDSSVRSMISQGSNATLLAPSSSASQPLPKRSSDEDLLVAEIIVDTKSYPAGYNVTTVVKAPPSTTSSPTDAPPPLPLRFDTLDRQGGLPLAISVSSLPPSVLHSASLSTSPPRRRHLIRITLPTSQFSRPPVQDPLRGDQRAGPTLPAWYKALEHAGAVVLVSLDSLAGQPYDDEGEVLVTVNGAVVVVSAAPLPTKTKALKQDKSEAYDDVASHWPRLSRSLVQPGEEPRVDAAHPSLPSCLARPVAVATHLFPDPPPSAALDPSSPLPTPTTEAPPGTPVLDGADTPNGGLATVPPTPAVSRRASTATTNPLMNFFHRARTGSVPPGVRGGDKSGDGTPGGGATPGVSQPTSSKLLNNLLATYSFDRIPRNRTFALSTLVLVGLISFLLGSLMRSLLTPADFVLYDARPGAATAADVVDEQWREIRRLVEWRGAWLGDDLVVAVVRRGAQGN